MTVARPCIFKAVQSYCMSQLSCKTHTSVHKQCMDSMRHRDLAIANHIVAFQLAML